jgi:hypothetical protein
MTQTIIQTPAKRSSCRRRGCIGCLALIGLTICLGGVLIFAGPSFMRATGLAGPSAEDIYSGAPDPVASAAVTGILTDAGISGARAVVIPMKGSEGNVALITLDGSAVEGAGSEAANQQAFEQIIQDLAAADREGMNLSHVVVDYRDENGESLISMGASQDDINAYAAGEIAQNQFLYQVEVDFSRLISADMLQQLMEGSQQ